jgi:hypothetical protein
MTVLAGTYCLDCFEYISLNDGYGILGYPSLSTEKLTEDAQWDDPDFLNFGFIYTGFKALKLLSYEVVCYYDFLKKHHSHRIYLSTDHDESNPKEFERYEEFKSFKTSNTNFIDAHYMIECHDCNEEFKSRVDDKMKVIPFEEFLIPQESINIFREKVLSADYHVFCTGNSLDSFDFLEPLDTFLAKHAEHEIVASLLE